MKINLTQNKNFKLLKSFLKSPKKINQTVYIVGGYVRDLLMQRKAPTDIDFVTEQSGIELAKAVGKELGDLKVSVLKLMELQ